MEEAITAIQDALKPDATIEMRAMGAAACRSILAVLEPKPTAPSPILDAAGVASLVAAVRAAPPDQLLDLAIAKLRSALPAGADAEVTVAKPLSFQFVPVARPTRRP
jgi:hypothetical protein